MSKPLRKDRPEWARKRIEDAYQTAEQGEGWLALSRAWNVTQAAALQWCRDNVPREICRKIGENGMALCTRGRTRKYEFAKPRLVAFDPLAKRTPNDVCRKIAYRDGAAFECGAPTEGRTYCPSCSRHLITLTDRVAPETQRAAIHPWSEEGIQRATRAKKRA